MSQFAHAAWFTSSALKSCGILMTFLRIVILLIQELKSMHTKLRSQRASQFSAKIFSIVRL